MGGADNIETSTGYWPNLGLYLLSCMSLASAPTSCYIPTGRVFISLICGLFLQEDNATNLCSSNGNSSTDGHIHTAHLAAISTSTCTSAGTGKRCQGVGCPNLACGQHLCQYLQPARCLTGVTQTHSHTRCNSSMPHPPATLDQVT